MNDKPSPNNPRPSIEVTYGDLPLSCPLPNQKVWDKHPRVYLAIEEAGSATCPYCGAHYRLNEVQKSVE